MKRFLIIILIFIFTKSSANILIEQTPIFNEISDIISNGYHFLGKSEYQILTMKKPFWLENGNTWKITTKIPDDISEVKKVIHIQTGTGALISLYISNKSDLVFKILYTPFLLASFEKLNLFLKEKYSIDEKGFSKPIKTNNSEYIIFNLTIWYDSPYVVISAFDTNSNTFKFK